MAVVPDDDNGLHNADEEAPRSPRSQTPPTPPVQDEPSPPPSPRPLRQRAMAQLRPVSIPNVVCDIAGPDPLRKIADFDRHYMPHGQSGRDMLASWERMKFSLFCQTSLQGFCSSFTLIALKASISPSYPQTEVILMCMEHCWMIRYMNTSYSEH